LVVGLHTCVFTLQLPTHLFTLLHTPALPGCWLHPVVVTARCGWFPFYLRTFYVCSVTVAVVARLLLHVTGDAVTGWLRLVVTLPFGCLRLRGCVYAVAPVVRYVVVVILFIWLRLFFDCCCYVVVVCSCCLLVVVTLFVVVVDLRSVVVVTLFGCCCYHALHCGCYVLPLRFGLRTLF